MAAEQIAHDETNHVHERSSPGRALAIGLGLTFTFALVEVAAGLISGSLALVADAGHMLVDSAGLVLALVATMIARRPKDLRRTYGYARAEVLVVPVHVLFMLLIAGYIVYEALSRIGDQPEIDGAPVLLVGAVGLAINFVTLRLLQGHSHDNLNARGAMFEVMADMLGSVGVVVAAAVLLTTGWSGVDVIVSLVIGALVVPRAFALLRHALAILLEGTPPGVSPDEITRDMENVPGVLAVHDLHVWALAPSFVALSAHLEVNEMTGCETTLTEVTRVLKASHNISHITLQPETRELHEAIDCCLSPDSVADATHLHTSGALMKRIWAVALAVILAGLSSSQGAQAHAAPAKVTPGDGAVLTSSPAKISIEMSQEMARQPGGNDIDVLGPDGTEVTTDTAAIDNANRRLLSVGLPASLPAGKYVVKWKTLSSDDGDPANGELSFTIDPAGPAQPGKEILREELGGSPTPAAGTDSVSAIPTAREPDGVTWVLVIAVGVGALVLGAGGTFLLVEKREETSPTRARGSRK